MTIPLQETEAGCERGPAVNQSLLKSNGKCFDRGDLLKLQNTNQLLLIAVVEVLALLGVVERVMTNYRIHFHSLLLFLNTTN